MIASPIQVLSGPAGYHLSLDITPCPRQAWLRNVLRNVRRKAWFLVVKEITNFL